MREGTSTQAPDLAVTFPRAWLEPWVAASALSSIAERPLPPSIQVSRDEQVMGCTYSILRSFLPAGVVVGDRLVSFNSRRFRVLRTLGEGGYAYVYLVREEELSNDESTRLFCPTTREYALKKVCMFTLTVHSAVFTTYTCIRMLLLLVYGELCTFALSSDILLPGELASSGALV